MILQSGGLVGSFNILETLYLHSQKTYEYQNRQGNDLPWDWRHQREILWEIQKIMYPFSQDIWWLNLAGCWLQGGGLERNHLSRHRILVIFVNDHFAKPMMVSRCKAPKLSTISRVRALWKWLNLWMALTRVKVRGS